MFIVNSYVMAVVLCVITMICWGSWGNTQKLAAKSWRYELYYWDYVIGMVLFSLLLGFTAGSIGDEGRHFIDDLTQCSWSAVGSVILGGIIFNASNILLSASVSLAGMSVAFPLGVGISLVLGVIINYIGDPKGNALLLALGVALVVIAIICSGIASGRMSKGGEETSQHKKGIMLAVCAGILMSFFYRFVAAAMDLNDFQNPAPGMLTPYGALFIFSIGVLLSNFIFNTYAMRRPFVGTPVSYKQYFAGSFGTHMVGVLGGCIWCLGTACSYIAAGKAGAAISYALGQGAPMIAAAWGVFVWKEFRGADKKTNALLSLMFALFIGGLGVIVAAGNNSGSEKPVVADESSRMGIIFDTDMGNDVDDALALDMLFKYQEEGAIDLLGIASSKPEEGSMEYLDILTTFYGHPDTPLGRVVGGGRNEENTNYALAVAAMTDSLGNPLYKRSHSEDGFIVPAVEMYRKILASRPDTSVTIVAVGFSTNLSQLLDSGADEYSELSGRELVSKKVKHLVMMAGHMSDPNFTEYNIYNDRPAAQKVFAEWPTPLVTSPFEVGEHILYPGESIENDFTEYEHHPMVDGYRAYLPMPYDRSTWDLTSVLYAVEGDGDYFGVSDPGEIVVSDGSITTYTPVSGGTRYYLTVTPEQRSRVLDRFKALITKPVSPS